MYGKESKFLYKVKDKFSRESLRVAFTWLLSSYFWFWRLLILFGILYAIFGPSSVTKGPTARCRDGHLSYSQDRSGTCSWHGGVAEWDPESK
ncbi:MAG: DUF3761 domain-containing protein [Edaphobacter sp.]